MQFNKYAFILSNFGLASAKSNFYTKYGVEDSGINQDVGFLGNPVFGDIYLKSLNDNENLQLHIDTVLIDISQSKNIVKTAVQGRSTTVKEYVSRGDYQVILRGILVEDGSSTYPEVKMSYLRQLLEKPEAIGIANDYCNRMGIFNIVVESYRFPMREGFQNAQTFEITALEDRPIEFLLEEEK